MAALVPAQKSDLSTSRTSIPCNADFAQFLIGIARPLYANDNFGLELNETVYALDSSGSRALIWRASGAKSAVTMSQRMS